MARKMSPDEYQELGRGYYKLKQYEKAVEAFTQGIDIAPTLSLYDHRAAAYDRLEEYDAAIRDGRNMIKWDKQDVKGYLRTTSLLEKMQKFETALGIYKYGMKNVPVGDKNFKVSTHLPPSTPSLLTPSSSFNNYMTRSRASCRPRSQSTR
jgi:F-box/TPR repeat protein Pof3